VINNYYNTTVVNKNVSVNNVSYMNQNVHGAVTATSGQSFTSAQPVARNLVQVNQREVASAPVAVRAPSVVPPKQAVLGAGTATRYQPPAALQGRAVVAKTAPPPTPLPFAQRQEAIKANQGQPISIAQSRQLSQQQPHPNNVSAVRVAPPAKVVSTPPMGNRNVPSNVAPNGNRPPNANGNQNVNPGGNRAVNNNTSTNANANANVNRPMNNNNSVDSNGNVNGNPNAYKDRPPTSRPAQTYNPQLEEKHQEQIQQLQQKQDHEYQKVQQKQNQEQQKLQQHSVDAQKQQQVQQQQQQKLQQMEDKHNQQREQLQQKQDQEHVHAQQNQSKPPKEDRPPKPEEKPHH